MREKPLTVSVNRQRVEAWKRVFFLECFVRVERTVLSPLFRAVTLPAEPEKSENAMEGSSFMIGQ
jgi:hypothetical protein